MSLVSKEGQTVASASWEAKIIRASGEVEDLGVIAYHSSNPFRLYAWKFSQWLRGKTAGRVTGA